MKSLLQETILAATALLNNGESYSMISQRLGISKKAISTIKNKHLPDLSPNKAGRRRVLTDHDDRYLSRKIASGVADTAVAVAKIAKNDLQKVVSAETVRRSLRRVGLKSAIKVKKPLLAPRHIRQRYQWALKYKEWTVEDRKR